MSEQEQRLRERVKRSQRDAGKRGLGRASVLDLTAYSPSWYKALGGKTKNVFDILPFKISQDWYSKLKTRAGNTVGLEVGDLDYKLEVPVHRQIGPNNDSFLCLREAFGKACPICEDKFKEFEKGKQDRDEDLIKALNASWRCIYNVYDYNNDKEEIQLFEISYKMFEELLLEEAQPEGDRLEPIYFSSLTAGVTIEWKGKEKSLGKSNFIEATSFEFLQRDAYGEEVLDQVYPLDKMLIIPTYDEVQKAYLDMSDDEEEGEEREERDDRPTKKRFAQKGRTLKGRTVERDEEEVQEELEEIECPAGLVFGRDCDSDIECTECDEDTHRRCKDNGELDAGYERGVRQPDKLRRRPGRR